MAMETAYPLLEAEELQEMDNVSRLRPHYQRPARMGQWKVRHSQRAGKIEVFS